MAWQHLLAHKVKRALAEVHSVGRGPWSAGDARHCVSRRKGCAVTGWGPGSWEERSGVKEVMVFILILVPIYAFFLLVVPISESSEQ